MIVVAARDDRRDSHCAHGMNGIEAAIMKRVVRAIEKTVGVGSVAGGLQRLPSRSDGLHGIEEKAVDEGLAGTQRGILRVGALAQQADAIDRRADGDDYRGRVRATESAVGSAKVVGGAEWRRAVWVGGEEAG